MKKLRTGQKIFFILFIIALCLLPVYLSRRNKGPGPAPAAETKAPTVEKFVLPEERPAPEGADPVLKPSYEMDIIGCVDTFHWFLYIADLNESQNEDKSGLKEKDENTAWNQDEVWGGVFVQSGNYAKSLKENMISLVYNMRFLKASGDTEITSEKNRDFGKNIEIIIQYILNFLSVPGGGFYRGQYADFVLDGKIVEGKDLYKLDDKERRKIGMPSIVREIDNADNIMFAVALLGAADAMKDNSWRDKAIETIRFIEKKDMGAAERQILVFGFLEAYQGTGELEWLDKAIKTEVEMKDLIEAGGPPVKEEECGEPDFREAAAVNLNRLFHLTDDEIFKELMAKITVNIEMTDYIKKVSGGYPLTAAVVGPADDPMTKELRRQARIFFEPNKVVMTLDPVRDAERLAELPYQARPQPTLYACVETACSMPMSDPEKVQPQLRKFVDKYMYKKDPGLNKFKLQ